MKEILSKMILVVAVLILLTTLENYGQSSNSSLQTGIAKYQKKDYEGALVDFEKAVKENAKDYKCYRWKGRSLEKLNRFKEAIQFYTYALELNKNDTLAYRGRGESRRFNHEFDASISDYDNTILLNPNDLGALYGRATSLFELKRYDEAIRDYSSFIQKNKKNSLVYLMRSAAYAANRQYQESKEDVKCYFQKGGMSDPGYYYRGMANIFLGGNNPVMMDSAIVDLKRYTTSKDELNSKDYKGYQLLGLAYAKKEDSVNARLNFRKSLELNPRIPTTYARWGSSEISFGNYKKADELLSSAYNMLDDPNGPYSDFYYNIALAKVGLQDTTAAVDFFGKCVKADSNRRDAYESRLSFIYGNTRYNRIILHDLQQLVRLSHDDGQKAEWYSMKSLIYYRAGQLDSARNEVDKALGLMPDEPLHYMIRAAVNATANQSSEVVLNDIDKAIRLHPSLPEAYMLKASYYASKKDYKHGCEALKRALEMGADVPKDARDYICKGKLPKSGKAPQLYVPLSPKLEKNLQSLNGADW